MRLRLVAFVLAAFGVTMAHAADDKLGRMAALVNYVGADYHLAVSDGKVVSQSELEEQLGLLSGVRESAVELPLADASLRPKLLASLDAIKSLMESRADEARVAEACRALFAFMVKDLGLDLSPPAPPDLARGQVLFAQNCVSCHGADGSGNTPLAQTLKPPPASFRDEDRVSRISPTLAYQSVSFGVAGTAMPAFSQIAAVDRWHLAAYVVALRQPKPATAVTTVPSELRDFRTLAALSDRELASKLVAAGVQAPELAIASLRHGLDLAPTAHTSGFATAKDLLAKVTVAPDAKAAKQLIIAAYLDGVEPEEAGLKARNPELTSTIEASFNELRIEAEQKQPAELARAVQKTTLLLDTAIADQQQQKGGNTVPFLGALTIALREGFELSLLLAALLAFVRKSGQGERARVVHFGWLAAVPAGLLTWVVVGKVMSGAARELSEAILTLSAAIMLLFVSHLVLGAEESRRWLKFLERRTKAAGQSESPAWPLFLLAFVAAYREAVEIVLFFRSLALQSNGAWGAIAAGAAVGVLALMVVVKGLDYLGKRLNPRPVMRASGLILTVLAVALVGQGVHALQAGGYVGLSPVGVVPTLSTLGLYPTMQTLIAQLVTVGLILVPFLPRGKKDAPPTPPAASPPTLQKTAPQSS